MFKKPSLLLRIGVGKGIGFAIGLAGLVFLPYFVPDADWMIRIGMVLWYTTVGAVIGMFGVINYHPLIKLPLPWWFRGPWIGGWMNFVLVFFAYDHFAVMMTDISLILWGNETSMTSPFWFAAEGAVVGLLIGYFATLLGGEGPKTAGH